MWSEPACAARVYICTLGCPKNEADSRAITRKLAAAGLQIVEDPDEATHILVNTCGFIREAKEESIGTILAACKRYEGKSVVVFGCLVERYEQELRSGIPEVTEWLGVVGPGFERKLRRALGACQTGSSSKSMRQLEDGRESHAYLKISDGCEEGCTFCAIPAIKGPYSSMPAGDVLEEAGALLDSGVRELILVGQDTTRWRNGGLTLIDLIDELCSDARVSWVRVMYFQPAQVDRSLLEFMASRDRVCSYLDVPFQHSHAEILKRMGRRGDGEEYMTLLREARLLMPDVWLRSTFIVGFPGESEEHFEDLLAFVEEAQFDYAGGFVYSPEEGTRAEALRPRVSARTAQQRLNRLHETIEGVAEQKRRALIGTEMEVMLDDLEVVRTAEGAAAIGHVRGQAPDVDGITYVEGSLPDALVPGDIVRVRISAAVGSDLIGEFCAH